MENNFSLKIKELRENLKLTQSEFADNLGVTQAALSAYEKGTRNPTFETIMLVSKKFNVSLDWLCGLSEIKSLTTKLTTYRDVFQILANICSTKYEDGKSTILFPSCKDGVTADTLFIASEDPNFHAFFAEYKKILGLYLDGTIDIDIYSIWLKKEINKYDFPLNKMPSCFQDIPTAKGTP